MREYPNTYKKLLAKRMLSLGQLATGAEVFAYWNDNESCGLVVKNAGKAAMRQANPVRFEIYNPETEIVEEWASGYAWVDQHTGGFIARAEISLVQGARILIDDYWTIGDSTLGLKRTARVMGNSAGGFLSAVILESDQGVSISSVEPFVPGMIYGNSDYITPTAIGGAAHYEAGVRQVRIREDRLSIPMVGLYFKDGTSVTVLNAKPDGGSNVRDAEEKIAQNQINEGCRVAALGYCEEEDHVTLGLWFPGTEGEVTYQWALAPFNQVRKWRGRYHPLQDGFTQQYEVEFRFARDESFDRYYTNAWRFAWAKLEPKVVSQDIETVRQTIAAMVADRVISRHGKSGIPTIWDSTTGEEITSEDAILIAKKREAVMGFLGRNTDLAYFLLYEAARNQTAQSERYYGLAVSILNSFAAIPMSPPAAEGFSLDDGSWVALTYRGKPLIHLRALSEGVKSMLKAWELERNRGRDHDHWLRWCKDFADWLLTQQSTVGGFPRAWSMASGEVGLDSTKSSYNAVPFLVHLSNITGKQTYLDAALRAADFSWTEDHSLGHFVGGTLDNPNVVDKEAGTLALEAYLALYEVTGEEKWLKRATTAANFAETWIYCWNVPMPEDAGAGALHWRKGVSSIGFQLISTGHSAVDGYMAFDAANYAKLYTYTQDQHYLDVARILLHNTKQMLALPGLTYDLAGPGWQQEGWNLSPPRGCGWHRHWLPWVAASHLEGIVELEKFDSDLYRRLAE
jgi:hypothetical protein